jgi:hypothetical protein
MLVYDSSFYKKLLFYLRLGLFPHIQFLITNLEIYIMDSLFEFSFQFPWSILFFFVIFMPFFFSSLFALPP